MKCLATAARRTARGLTRLYDEALSPAGLTAPQFALLSQIKHRPDCPQQTLCDAVDLDQTTLSRNLRLMSEHGWVQRSVSPDDKRAASYRITKKGASLQNQAMPLWESAQKKMRDQLGPNWQHSFELLQQLTAAAAVASPNTHDGQSLL
jgi:DNA-binding MarR family transcriptional regulator